MAVAASLWRSGGGGRRGALSRSVQLQRAAGLHSSFPAALSPAEISAAAGAAATSGLKPGESLFAEPICCCFLGVCVKFEFSVDLEMKLLLSGIVRIIVGTCNFTKPIVGVHFNVKNEIGPFEV